MRELLQDHLRSSHAGQDRDPPRSAVRDLLQGALRAGSAAVLLGGVLVGLHGSVSDPAGGAKLRVAVRTTAGTGQVCRRLTAEELEKLAMHMRREEVCETHAVPYRLEVRRGDAVVFVRDYSAAGLHGDRPLTVTEDLVVAAGRHDIAVRLAPTDPAADAPAFEYEGSVEFADGRIRVAVLDAADTAFTIH